MAGSPPIPPVERLGWWVRGNYRLRKHPAAGWYVAVDLRTASLAPYQVPLPIPVRINDRNPTELASLSGQPGEEADLEPGDTTAAGAQREAPLFDLLQLRGRGQQAASMVDLYEHWQSCGSLRCRQCRELRQRVLRFVNKWGPLGVSNLQVLGNRVMKDYWEKGAFGPGPYVPLALRPEPVDLILYSAALLWSWWEVYLRLGSHEGQEGLVDQLLWGVDPDMRRRYREYVLTAVRTAPEYVPPGFSPEQYAAAVTERVLKNPAGASFELIARYLMERTVAQTGIVPSPETFPELWSALEASARQFKDDLERVTSGWQTNLADLRQRSLQQIQRSKEAAAFLMQLWNQYLLNVGSGSLRSTMEEIMAAYQRAISGYVPVESPKAAEAVLTLVRARPPYLHPGLNQLMREVRVFTEYAERGWRVVYDFPTLWHAIHVELYLYLIRGDALLDRCAHCNGPLLRFPARERGQRRKYCSAACQRAAQPDRRRVTDGRR